MQLKPKSQKDFRSSHWTLRGCFLEEIPRHTWNGRLFPPEASTSPAEKLDKEATALKTWFTGRLWEKYKNSMLVITNENIELHFNFSSFSEMAVWE